MSDPLNKKAKRLLNYNVAVPSPKLTQLIKPKKISQAFKNMTISEKALFTNIKQQWGKNFLEMNLFDSEMTEALDNASESELREYQEDMTSIHDQMQCQWAILVTQLRKAANRNDRHTAEKFNKFTKRKNTPLTLSNAKLTADNCAFDYISNYECKTHSPRSSSDRANA